MKEKVIVSIVIPEWNRIDEIKKVLKSITKQTFKNYELVIVDNGSTDGTKEMIRKNYPKCKLICLRENVGASRARNIGVLNSVGKYVWFLDSDAFPVKKDCLKDMIKIMENDPKIGQLGGEIVEGMIRLPQSLRNQDGLFIFEKKVHMREVEAINTSNCIMKRELIWKVGGFDPTYFYGYEDNNVSFLVKKYEYKCIVDSKVMAIHERSLKGRASTFYLWHRNRVRFIILKEKNPFFILFLPFIDVYTTLKLLPKKLEILKNSKVVSKSNQKESVLKTGFIFITSMIQGYLWALLHFPQIMHTKITKPNFLEKERKTQ